MGLGKLLKNNTTGNMKAIILILLSLLISSTLHAQAAGIPGPYRDLNDTEFVQDALLQSDIQRAIDENYWGDIDEAAGQVRRFGPRKPLDFYVQQRADAKAKEDAERAMNEHLGHVDNMLNNALQQEQIIRDQLLSTQAKMQNMNLTMFQWNDKIGKLEQTIATLNRKNAECKRTRGRRC